MNRDKNRRNKKFADKDIKKAVSIQASSLILVGQEQTLTIQQATDLAIKNHQAGNLPKAERIYQQILEADPNQTDSLHYLGLIAHQVGENDRAVKLISGALKIKPDYAEAHCNLGLTLKDLGQLNNAVASYNKALALCLIMLRRIPTLALSFTNLGKLIKLRKVLIKQLTSNPTMLMYI